MHYLLVGVGGFLGAVARYWLGRMLMGQATGFPLATLVVNVTGSFLIGVVASLLLVRGAAGDDLRLLLVVGFLGAFTTFSSFSYETLSLMEHGAWFRAGLNVFANVVMCLLAVTIGSLLARQFIHG